MADAYEEAVRAIERDEGWTEEDAHNCGCNSHPEGPCDRCWSLGWRIGGIDRQALKGQADGPQ